MDDADRFRLLGRYRTPRFRVGRRVRCLVRGEVEIAGVHDGPIPWPVCKTARRHALVVYAGLARALRQEAALAVARWWGVGHFTVSKRRKELGVGATTEGTSRLRSAYCDEPWFEAARRAAHAKARDPARREKIAAALRGRPQPWHVIEAMAAGRRSKPHSEETRRKMSKAHNHRGTRPPNTGRSQTPEEADLVRTLPAVCEGQRIGRTLEAA
jgi:hypothetical protein